MMCFVLCLKSIHLEQLATRFHFGMFLMDSGPFVVTGGVLDYKVWSGTGQLGCACSGISHCETSYVVVNDSDHPSVQIVSFMKGKKVKKEEMWRMTALPLRIASSVLFSSLQVLFSDSTCSEQTSDDYSLFSCRNTQWDDSADLNLSFHSLNKPGFNVSNHNVDPPAQPQIIHWKWLQV